jgi:hypothetical protein
MGPGVRRDDDVCRIHCIRRRSVTPWNAAPAKREHLMASHIDVLMEKLRGVEADIEVELAKRREALRYHFENRRIVFAEEVLRVQRAIKIGLSHYIRDANPLIMLTAPVIYSLIIPVALLDLFVMIYQAICFPVYGIPKVRRRDYLVFDRHHLAYLNLIEKVNCAYCSYCNGAIAFAREVASRTEVYWCPIKHARRVLGPHPHYQGFADFGDAEGYRDKLAQMKDGVTIDEGI